MVKSEEYKNLSIREFDKAAMRNMKQKSVSVYHNTCKKMAISPSLEEIEKKKLNLNPYWMP
eukprot:jgi/Orpsp1_1/1189824/evm.model.d7180000074771.1